MPLRVVSKSVRDFLRLRAKFHPDASPTTSAITLRAYNNLRHADIDRMRTKMIAGLGLHAADIIDIPAVFFPNPDTPSTADALIAGMVNMLVINGHAGVPKPFGPVVGGVDQFEKEVSDLLSRWGSTSPSWTAGTPITSTWAGALRDQHAEDSPGAQLVGVPTMTAEWFETAVEAEEAGYLEAETQLREAVRADADQWTALTARLDDPDPMARLICPGRAQRRRPGQVPSRAGDAYLARVKRPTTHSRPGAADSGCRRGADRAGRHPTRRAAGPAAGQGRRYAALAGGVSLAYLTRHPTPAAIKALLRYATRTAEPRLQTVAAPAVAASQDRDLRRKLAAETSRLAASGQALPAAVTSVLA